MGLLSLTRSRKFSSSDLPQTYTFSSDSLSVTAMSTTSYSSSGSRPTSRHHDTGFPDSFSSRTTSMRHPDAIIDPSYSITADDIDPAKTMHRSRKSLLRKHRRTISQGKIPEGLYGPGHMESPPSGPTTGNRAADFINRKSHDAGTGIGQSSKTDNAEDYRQAKGTDNIMGLGAPFQYTEDGEDSEERRRGNIFRKLMSKN